MNYSTWSALRGDANRTWYRRSDIVDACIAAGYPVTRNVVDGLIRKVVTEKPESRYGHHHYRREHLDAVLEAARRKYAKRMVGSMGDRPAGADGVDDGSGA